MAERDREAPPEIPDLDLPRAPAVPSRAARAAGSGALPALDTSDDDMVIERGGAISPSVSSGHGGIGLPGVSRAPPSSRASSGLEVAYHRLEPRAVAEPATSTLGAVLAWALPLLLAAGVVAALVKLAHRPGGWSVLAMSPHAFDASSTAQSGAVAVVSLVLAIGLGFGGLRLRPRSYLFLGAGAALVLTALAMVTVTLVSTEEHPGPPDGALLVPWVVPLAVALIGLGTILRGPSLFARGGLSRVLAATAGVAGGAILFVGFEISVVASRLP